MDPVDVVAASAGLCSWRVLRQSCPLPEIRRAIREGRIVRVRRGSYGLAGLDETRALALRHRAVVSHASAVTHWGWQLKQAPDRPHLTIARSSQRINTDAAHVHWRDLPACDVLDGWVTGRVRTVVDCCLDLPFDEALVVFDSAWRAFEKRGPNHGVSRHQVLTYATRLGSRHRRRVESVARLADWRSAGAFESVLRAIALQVKGLRPSAQVIVDLEAGRYTVDVCDWSLRIVIEAESKAYHSSGASLLRDCRRYSDLGSNGLMVLRFTWAQVMHGPHEVRYVLNRAVAQRRRDGWTVPDTAVVVPRRVRPPKVATRSGR